MKDIFDMTAGTSTGSILAAGLAYPDVTNTELVNQNINKNYKPDEVFIKPGFFAPELVDIYAKRGGEIFVSRKNNVMLILSIIIFIVIFGVMGHQLGCYFYDS